MELMFEDMLMPISGGFAPFGSIVLSECVNFVAKTNYDALRRFLDPAPFILPGGD